MSIYIQTHAITLKKQPIRENDRLYVFYTHDLGKVSAVARGASKIKSKLAGHLEPFSICQVLIVKKNVIPCLASAQIQKRFSAVSDGLETLAIANQCFKITDEIIKEGHPDKNIYNLLEEFLEAFQAKPAPEKLKIFHSIFILKLLSLLGYQPQLYYCVKCKKEIKPTGNSFSTERGGLICQNCGLKDIGSMPISDNTIKLLRTTLTLSLAKILKIKVGQELSQEFNKIIKTFLEYRL